MSLHDRATLAAGAAPGVADPVQPEARELVGSIDQPHRPNRDVMAHPASMRPPLLERQCLSCGVVAACYPGQPCETCGASSFHLIPLRTRAA